MKSTLSFVRASELYDPGTGVRIAYPSFLAPSPVEATDDDVRAAVEGSGL